jgi:xylulokinase
MGGSDVAYLVGIDLGTSSVKVLVMDEDGRIAGQATADYPLYTPHPGWAEQEPEEWWQATVQAVKTAVGVSGVRPAELVGLGLSGQMHGSVFLDVNGSVIYPALLWCDQRTESECREIEELVGGRERLLQLTLNQALTGFTAPKILWLRNHEPDRFARTRQILLPKDYIRYRLTGEFATEVSDASGTLLLDISNRWWSSEMLEALGLDAALLPRVLESPEVSGRVTPRVAAELGLPAGLPVVGGGGDQATGAVGMGVVRPGVLSVTVGTSGVVFAPTETPAADIEGRLHTFCHAVPGQWHVMGVTLAAGGSLRWYRDTFGGPEIERAKAEGREPYEYITAQAGTVPAGSEGLVFLPYLAGERTPYPDPHASGVFFGATLRSTKAHFSRAILEGVAYSLKDCLRLVSEAGVPVREVRTGGGGARSALWRQIQADVFGVDLLTVNADEGAAYGAALLAGVGVGVFPDVPSACDRMISVVDKTLCNKELNAEYREFYALYRSLYPALVHLFHQSAALRARATV